MEENQNTFRLRPLEEKDAPLMLEWLLDEAVTRYLRLNSSDSTLDDALEFINDANLENGNLHRAITDDKDRYLGTVSLKNIDKMKKEAEYAIALHKSAMGTGAALAASKMIIRLAFETLGLQRLYLSVLRINQRAVRFYDKLGFNYTHSDSIRFNGEDEELLWYEVTNDGTYT